MPNRLFLQPLVLLIIGAISGSAAGQQDEPKPQYRFTDQPVSYQLQDEPQAGESLPELPETVVRGRPESFPSNPLEGDTVVSPTRTETRVGDVGSRVTVVSGDEIRASGRTAVSEVLRDVVGADVTRQGGPGGLTSVFLRGTNSQHTKVLLDGIPINDPSNATRGFDFSTLDVENIDRIEVLRGPQSLLYGSDAIGGVINIITRRGDGPLSLRSSSRGGAFGTYRQSLQVSGGDETTYYSFGGSHGHTDGISQAARRLGNTESDAYGNGTLSGRFGWTPSDLLNVDYVFRWADVDAEVDDFSFFTGLPVDNLIRHNLSRTFYNRVQAQSLMLEGCIEQTIGFSLADYDRDDTAPDSPLIPPTFRGQTRQVDWQANVLVVDSNTFSVGANYLQEDAHQENLNIGSSLQVSQNNVGLFVMDQFSLADSWFVTAGARWDDWNTAGSANTYRVTNLVRICENGPAVHGTIGTGFRAPALAENLFQFGNPDLRPESSKGWDVGVEHTFCDGRLLVDCTYFRNDLIDLIIFDFATFRLENVGQARSTGIEFVVLWTPDEVTTVRANYTYADTTNLDTNTQLVRRPRNKANLGVSRRLFCDRANIGTNLLYVGKRLDRRGSSYVVLKDYFLTNIYGTYDLTDYWTLFVRAENLFDEKYEEVLGYGTPGFAIYGGLDFVW